MRRDDLARAVRAARSAVRERGRAALHAVTSPAARDRLQRGWAVLRRRPDAALVAGVVAGVVVMILHWW
jgi:hypothetical protein